MGMDFFFETEFLKIITVFTCVWMLYPNNQAQYYKKKKSSPSDMGTIVYIPQMACAI